MKLLNLALLICVVLSSNKAYAKVNCPKNTTMYDRIILDASIKHKVDPALIHAVIKQESCYSLLAISHAGAEGLMQLMPDTAIRFNVTNSFDAKQNINAGAKYLAWLLNRFNGRVEYALAGYNAGEGRVDQYKGIPPFKETQNYVVKVMNNYRMFKGLHNNKSKIVVTKKEKYTKNNSRKPSGKRKKFTVRKPLIVANRNNKIRNSTSANFSKSRTAIRSVTVAMNSAEGREGYSFIRARRVGGVQ